jgi:hypothetical protein
MVDGVFSTNWNQFGCVHWEQITPKVDRTIAVSVLPHQTLRMCGNGLGSFTQTNIISPSLSDGGDALLLHLGRIAIFPSTKKELTQVFELGYKNGETWIRQEKDRQRHYDKLNRKKQSLKK